MRRHLLKLTTVLALTSWAGVATAASPPPQPGKAKELKFPAYSEKTLANGLKVIVVEHHEQPMVRAQILLPAGRLYETLDKAGISNAVASLLTQGAGNRGAQEIAEAIDRIGGTLDAQGGADLAGADVRVTTDQADLGLALLGDIVLRPTFPEAEIERYRRQTLSGLQLRDSNAGALAEESFARILFGGHPYGIPSGTQESVQAMTREALVAFHRRHYVPRGSVLAIVGDLKAADAFAKAEKTFGEWQGEAPPAPPKFEVPAADKLRIVAIDMPNAVQTEIRVGQVGLAYKDPDYFYSQVWNSVVGNGSSGRLYQEIRRKRGLSYGASSSWTEWLQPGRFRAGTSTKTESTVEALDLILGVFRTSQTEPVPEAELASAKMQLSGTFPIQIETPEGIANQVLDAVFYDLGKDFLDNYRSRIDAVTAAQVQSFAKKRLTPDKMLVVLAGNVKGFAEPLEKKYGPFVTIPATEVDLARPDLRKVEAAGK